MTVCRRMRRELRRRAMQVVAIDVDHRPGLEELQAMERMARLWGVRLLIRPAGEKGTT